MDFNNLEVQPVLHNRTFSIELEGLKGQVSRFCMHTSLKIMLPTEGGEHIFKNMIKIRKKMLLKVDKGGKTSKLQVELTSCHV